MGPERRSYYHFQAFAQTTVFAWDAIAQLPEALDELGVRRAMVICGQSILKQSNVVQRVEDALGPRLVGRFEQCVPHSPTDALEGAAAVAEQVQPDAVVTVGGGSTTTIGKGVALLLAERGPIDNYRVRFEPPATMVLPTRLLPTVKTKVIAVPTTLGCAEGHPSGGGFTDSVTGEKMLIHGDGRTMPRLVVIDGYALATTPKSVQTATAVGQLRMAVECFLSTVNNPFGDALALRAVHLLGSELRSGWKHDVEFLLRVKAAGTLAGLAVIAGESWLGVNSALAHQMGALCGVPHGEANAILLPHTLRFNMSAPDVRIGELAQAFCGRNVGNGTIAGEALAAAVEATCAQLEIPSRFRDIGVAKDRLVDVAESAFGDRSLATNPWPIMSRDPLLKILEAAW